MEGASSAVGNLLYLNQALPTLFGKVDAVTKARRAEFERRGGILPPLLFITDDLFIFGKVAK